MTLRLTGDTISTSTDLHLTGNNVTLTLGPTEEIVWNQDLKTTGNISGYGNLPVIITGNGSYVNVGAEETITFSDGSNEQKISNTRLGTVKRFNEYNGGRCNSTFIKTFAYLTTNNEIKLFGTNQNSRLGTGASTALAPGISIPLPPDSDEIISKIYCSNTCVLVLCESGNVYATGDNSDGQFSLEDNSTDADSVPFKKSSITNVIDVSFPENSPKTIYYLTTSGDLYAAGNNTYGQIGDRTQTAIGSSGAFITLGPNRESAGSKNQVTKVVSRGSGNYCTVAVIIDNGSILTAGYGGNGQRGDGTLNDTRNNLAWGGLSGAPASSIDALDLQCSGSSFNTTFYALYDNNDLYGWGYNGVSQITTGTSDQQSLILINRDVSDFWAHGDSNGRLFYKSSYDVKIYARGYNSNGCLGVGNTTTPISSNTIVSSLNSYNVNEIIGMDAGTTVPFTYVITSTGKLLASGDNSSGQLSNGTLTDSSTFELCHCSINNELIQIKNGFNRYNPYIFLTADTQLGVWILSEEGYIYYCGYDLNGSLMNISTSTVSYLTKMSNYI